MIKNIDRLPYVHTVGNNKGFGSLAVISMLVMWIVDSFMMLVDRIFVSKTLRQNVLKQFRSGNSVINKMKSLA